MSAAFFAALKELTVRVGLLEQEVAYLKAQAQESSKSPERVGQELPLKRGPGRPPKQPAL